MNQLDLRGRTAVVTGGASGIGLAIARRMVASGALVSLWDARAETLAEAAGVLGGAHTLVVDVRDYPAVEAARDATLRALGRIDALVNSAGITGPNALTWEYPLDGWRDVIDVNLTGTFHCCRALAAYSASKAGVIALTKSLGKELAQTGVRVNCVTPAAVETPMFAQMTQSHIDYMKSKIPMNRFGTIDEIAALVTWLCTEECSFSTGAVFDLSGGRSTY